MWYHNYLIARFISLQVYTGWRTKCHTIDCTHNTFLLLPHHLTSSTELILIGWKIVPNESLLFARSPPCTKVCTKTSLSRYYTLCFCIKQYNFHLLIYSQPPRCPPFYKLVPSIAFSMNYSIHSHVCNIDTMMLKF